MVSERGDMERIRGLVTAVDLDGEGSHTLHTKETEGNTRTLLEDWVIGATGRNCLLGKKLDLIFQPEEQRDCFWFWLADFDRSILNNNRRFR